MRSLLFVLLVVVSSAAIRADVRLVGTDLLGEEFTNAFNAYARKNEITVLMAMEGSRIGLEKLRAGEADLGIMMFSPEEPRPAGALAVVPAGYKTAVAVVPASLPLSQISYAQLSAIFGADDQSTIKRWTDLGVVGEWAPRSILPIMPAQRSGITHDLFRYSVLKTPKLKLSVIVEPSSANIIQRLKAEAGGIAILPFLPPDDAALKALLVAKDANDVAYGATPDNLHSGDYPLRLPVYLVFNKAAQKQLQPLLRFLLSEEAVTLWDKAQIFALPVQVRNQQIFDLEVP